MTKHDWISVDERLPQDYTCVLVSDGKAVYMVGFYPNDGFMVDVGRMIPVPGVTHWQPLPEPPK